MIIESYDIRVILNAMKTILVDWLSVSLANNTSTDNNIEPEKRYRAQFAMLIFACFYSEVLLVD